MKRKSWVWQYAHREGDIAFCYLCSDKRGNTFSCRGGTTGSLGRHLQKFHGISNTEENSFPIDNSIIDDMPNTAADEEPSTSKKRRIHTGESQGPTNLCSSERMEEIHWALVKMIALNQMPLSFCSSEGFLQFMAVVDPNFSPVKEEAIKKRLQALRQNIERVMKEKIYKASGVSFTYDCWPSVQASYMTMAAHLIDEDWVPRSFTLETSEMETSCNAENLAKKMENIFKDWGLHEKIMAVVTDNSANLVKAVESMEHVQENFNLTCAAHSLQFAVESSISFEHIQSLIEKGNRIVEYFKHFNVAKYALEEKQKQLGLPVLPLLQSCNTRWNSIFLMLQRLTSNRGPVTNVLTDRLATSSTKLELSEPEWTSLEDLANILEPIQVLTNILSSGDSPASMVRPLMHQLLEKHMMPSDNDSKMINIFKGNFSNDLRQRLHLQLDHTSSYISTRQIASLLDPRYKDLEHESYDVRAAIRDKLKQILIGNTQTTELTVKKKTALEFLYKKTETNQKDVGNQLEAYLAEPQLKFDLSPYDWWKYKEDKYPAIALLARRYLSVPATSVSPERCYLTAGDRASLVENVDLLVFLYQNRKLFPG